MRNIRIGYILITSFFFLLVTTTFAFGYLERLNVLTSQMDRWSPFLTSSIVERNYRNIDHTLMAMESSFPGFYLLESPEYNIEVTYPRIPHSCLVDHSIPIVKYGQALGTLKICQGWAAIVKSSLSSPLLNAVAAVFIILFIISIFGIWLVRYLSFKSVLFLLHSDDTNKVKIPGILNYFLNDRYFSAVKGEITKQQENIATLKNYEAFSKMKLEIARKVAHDIRSPLSALNMIGSQLSTHDDSKQIISDVISRINGIANDLLSATKNKPTNILSDKQDLHLDLEVEIHRIIKEKKISYPDFTFHIQNKSPNNKIQINLPVDEWNRIFSNLINNSIEASLKNKNIYIVLSEFESRVSISIVDFGIGIPQEILIRLGNEEITTKNSGSGIGVYESVKRVAEWGGRIDFRSKEDIGTEVEITIPKN